MKKAIFLLLATFLFQNMLAQYTEIINSKRPGFSESPYSIGTDVYQFETGYFYRSSNNPSFLGIPNRLGGELYFRYGQFSEKLEFSAKMSIQRDEIKNPFGTNYYVGGLSELTLGAKYLIYQQEYTDKSKEIRSWKKRMAFDKKRLIPSVGIFAGVNTNFLSEAFKEESVSFKGAILLQNDFSDRLVLLTNLIADKITSENNFYSYILTMTYALNYKWSYFIENQGIFKKTDTPKFNFGTGVAYLYSKNLQLDASIRTNFFENYSFLYSAVGLSWRLDRHSDEIINKSAPDAPLKQKRKRRKKGSFFSRFFKRKN